ncbi:MAG TPA: isoleucine--tRNA ligase [Terriglobales bacterium]
MAGSSYKSTLNLPETAFPMKANLPASEPQWLAKWREMDLYGRIRKSKLGRPVYLLHDGPPYANGAIHLGTALNKVVKDLVVKSKSMAGFDSPYVPGWDCHGLPIEIKVDKELGPRKASLTDVEIRQRCREYALKYVDLQKQGFERLAVFGQWDNPYLTLKPHYEASIAAQILSFIRQGFAYRGLRAVYWCIHDRTALAEAEVEYKEHLSPTVWIQYRFRSGSLPAGVKGESLYAAVWTTTPWTLPASVALAFHPDLEYVVVRDSRRDANYLVAAARMAATGDAIGAGWSEADVVARFCGRDIQGAVFSHPWLERAIPAVMADYITTDQGSGIVHTAPGHGAEDFATGEKNKLPVVCPVDAAGNFFGDETAPFTGQQVFAANPAIIEHLKSVGALLAAAPLSHSYPHCWRCHNPIIFRATEQWFIGLDRAPHDGSAPLRQRALEAIAGVTWMPEWGGERIRQMVASRPDWCISRQRVWGVPIPVLRCSGCEKILRDDATDERIVAAFAEHGSDIWFSRPAEFFLAPATRCAGCGCTAFVPERDIVDVWFESGCSQAAVLNDEYGLRFPADLYLEGGDQYRGWFQSSLLVAVGTRHAAPYRGTLTHGWVIDAAGHTMHKSLGNAIEPEEITGQYGAEILRLWVAASDYTQEISLSPDLLKRLAEGYRKVRNTFRYLLSNLHQFVPGRDLVAVNDLTPLDRYMLRQTAQLAQEVEREYAEFAFHRGYRRLADFCSVELSAFYLDVLKDRLYTAAARSTARRSAQTTLYHLLHTLVRLFAPILAFTSDEIWQNMRATGLAAAGESSADSVHLQTYMDVRLWLADDEAEAARWRLLREWREESLKALEAARQAKEIGTGLEARLILRAPAAEAAVLRAEQSQLPALFIVSQVEVGEAATRSVEVHRAPGVKCERCWNYTEDVGLAPAWPGVCARCARALEEMGLAAVR